MPSPFGTATLRLAPSALAPLGLRSAAKCAQRWRNIGFSKSIQKFNRTNHSNCIIKPLATYKKGLSMVAVIYDKNWSNRGRFNW